MVKKTFRTSLVVLAICGLVLGHILNTDWYKRHFGMGFSDRMNICVVLNGEHLAPSEYSLVFSMHSDDEGVKLANMTETGYSIDSGYGTYGISVELDKRIITFVIENTNNWVAR